MTPEWLKSLKGSEGREEHLMDYVGLNEARSRQLFMESVMSASPNIYTAPIKFSSTAVGGLGVACAALINKHFRSCFHLTNQLRIISYIVACHPAAMSILHYDRRFTKKLMELRAICVPCEIIHLVPAVSAMSIGFPLILSVACSLHLADVYSTFTIPRATFRNWHQTKLTLGIIKGFFTTKFNVLLVGAVVAHFILLSISMSLGLTSHKKILEDYEQNLKIL